MLRFIAVLVTIAPLLAAPTLAADISDADHGAIDAIIAAQISAFGKDDGAAAYGYASPTIQHIYPSADAFMNMVRKGYPQVYRPQRYNFTRVETDVPERPAQHVIIVGPDGKTYEAIYSMQRQPDGSWKINGCSIAELQGANA